MSRRIALCLALLAMHGAAQTIWNVPASASIDTYVAQASPGDILILAASAFGPFTLNKGVTVVGYGASIFSGFLVDVPPGQRASVLGTNLLGGLPQQYSTGFTVVRGSVAIADVGCQDGALLRVDATAGDVVLQRIRTVGAGATLQIAGGVCAIADTTLRGPSAFIGQFNSVPAQPALHLTGGRLIASNCVFRGGNFTGFGAAASAPGVEQTGGTAWITDSSLVGGDGTGAVPGSVALLGSGGVSIARTSLTEGVPSQGVSSGYSIDPAMVGISSNGQPQRGSTLSVTARAGTSQDVLVIVAGSSRGASTLPPVVEPLFGQVNQLVLLAIGTPAAGATLPWSATVPADPVLQGSEVWVQAMQIAAGTVRASAVVGGAIL